MLTALFTSLLAQTAAASSTSPAECRHLAMMAMTQGAWRYVVTTAQPDGTLTETTGSFRMQEVTAGVLEVSYPGSARPGFRLTRTAEGYRSAINGEAPDQAAEVRVASCEGPDADGRYAIVEVADREPSPSGSVASHSRVTATRHSIVFTVSERPATATTPFTWQYTMLLYRAD